jgi:hypothetical protein
MRKHALYHGLAQDHASKAVERAFAKINPQGLALDLHNFDRGLIR